MGDPIYMVGDIRVTVKADGSRRLRCPNGRVEIQTAQDIKRLRAERVAEIKELEQQLAMIDAEDTSAEKLRVEASGLREETDNGR